MTTSLYHPIFLFLLFLISFTIYELRDAKI